MRQRFFDALLAVGGRINRVRFLAQPLGNRACYFFFIFNEENSQAAITLICGAEAPSGLKPTLTLVSNSLAKQKINGDAAQARAVAALIRESHSMR